MSLRLGRREIFPARDRSKGQSLGSGTHWLCAAMLTLVFPEAVELFSPAQIFAFFCFMTVSTCCSSLRRA